MKETFIVLDFTFSYTSFKKNSVFSVNFHHIIGYMVSVNKGDVMLVSLCVLHLTICDVMLNDGFRLSKDG